MASTNTARVAARRLPEYGTRFGSPAVPEVRATESPAPASASGRLRVIPADGPIPKRRRRRRSRRGWTLSRTR